MNEKEKIERDSFVFYRSFYEAIKDLDTIEQSNLLCAICELALNGNEIELNGISSTIFKLIKPQINANTICEKLRCNKPNNKADAITAKKSPYLRN